MAPVLNFHPAMPPATGPRPERAKFLGDVAAGLEMLALFYAMSAAQQQAFIDFIRDASVGVAKGE